MLRLFKRWFGRSSPEPAKVDEPALHLEREAQTLRLDLQERDRVIAALKSDLERSRSGEAGRIAATVQAQVERLLSDAAGPIAQLLTQAHLLEVDGKPVQARDVLAVAKRLVRIMEDEGLSLNDRVGDKAPFDPNRHELLRGDVELTPGQPVVVRFVGVTYRGKVLRKAGVDQAGE